MLSTYLKYCLFIWVFLILKNPVCSQNDPNISRMDHDTLFIQTFPKSITSSIFLVGQFANMQITNSDEVLILDYEPNSLTGLGASVSAKWLSVSFSYGFRFLNPDEQQGETKALDFQTHIYSRKFVADLFVEAYKGMYLDNTLEINPDYSNPYYLRPDIDLKIFGASAFYIFNHDKYSAPAAQVQSERQLKSAGSILLGFEGYWGRAQADSVFAPYFLTDNQLPEIRGYDGFSFLKFGPSLGYAYTLVIAKRLYINLSLTTNFGMGQSDTHHTERGDESEFRLDVGAFGRFGFGYNTPRWCFGMNVIYNDIATRSVKEVPTVDFGISQVHFSFIRRFNLGEKLESHIDKVKVPFIN